MVCFVINDCVILSQLSFIFIATYSITFMPLRLAERGLADGGAESLTPSRRRSGEPRETETARSLFSLLGSIEMKLKRKKTYGTRVLYIEEAIHSTWFPGTFFTLLAKERRVGTGLSGICAYLKILFVTTSLARAILIIKSSNWNPFSKQPTCWQFVFMVLNFGL